MFPVSCFFCSPFILIYGCCQVGGCPNHRNGLYLEQLWSQQHERHHERKDGWGFYCSGTPPQQGHSLQEGSLHWVYVGIQISQVPHHPPSLASKVEVLHTYLEPSASLELKHRVIEVDRFPTRKKGSNDRIECFEGFLRVSPYISLPSFWEPRESRVRHQSSRS